MPSQQIFNNIPDACGFLVSKGLGMSSDLEGKY